jgi:hypothetical protein
MRNLLPEMKQSQHPEVAFWPRKRMGKEELRIRSWLREVLSIQIPAKGET